MGACIGLTRADPHRRLRYASIISVCLVRSRSPVDHHHHHPNTSSSITTTSSSRPMSLLGGVNYGSDGSDDEESRGAPVPAPAPAPRRSTAPAHAALKKTGKKKKKAKVALSILPPEIQAALLRAPPPGQQGAGYDEEDVDEDDAEQELDEEVRSKTDMTEECVLGSGKPCSCSDRINLPLTLIITIILFEQERARRRKIRAQVAETKAIEGRKAAGAKGLFALLPKPKAEEALGACLFSWYVCLDIC